MLAWLSKNIATIIICLVLAVIVALIIFSLVKNKKKGNTILFIFGFRISSSKKF